MGRGGSACGDVKHACVKRFALIGLVVFALLACAACGGGSKQAAGSRALPPSLVKQIQAAVRKPSPIGGASSVKTVEVYGPAFGFADRLPAAVSRLGGHAVVDLS